METWLPLYVAAVGALGAIGVAFWNSRGDSAALRQLKSLNEAIEKLGDSPTARKAVSEARDGLALRIAVSTAAAPARRRLAWRIVQVVFGLSLGITGVLLATPWLNEAGPEVWANTAAIAAGVAVVAAFAWNILRRRSDEAKIAKAEKAQLERMLQLSLSTPPPSE